MLCLLIIAYVGSHYINKSRIQIVFQGSSLATILGIVAGFILWYTGDQNNIDHLTNIFSDLFLLLLLPPIIFDGGYNMKKWPYFFWNFGTILNLAFLGTFIAIFSTSMLIYAFAHIPGLTNTPLTLKECWAFGSLISATDPVAVLSVFNHLNADDDLFSFVFGESILNDVVSMVMYRTIINGTHADYSYEKHTIISCYNFVVSIFGSLFIGLILALCAALVIKL